MTAVSDIIMLSAHRSMSLAMAPHGVHVSAIGPGSIMTDVLAAFEIVLMYSISKVCRSMALSMAPHNVRVNAIGPGSIMTDVLAAVASDTSGMRRILGRTPMMRIGDPLEVGQVPLAMNCDISVWLVGQRWALTPLACATSSAAPPQCASATP